MAGTSESRIKRSALLITLGTTHNRPAVSMQEWHDSLPDLDRQQVAHMRVDTTTLDQEYGYNPDLSLHIAVPSEMSDRYLYGDLLGSIEPAIMDPYIAVSSLDGGTGQRNDATVALANGVHEVYRTMLGAIRKVLAVSSEADFQPRRELNIIVRTFIGSSTGAGLLVPTLFLLRAAKRELKISANIEAHITVPDESPGFDMLVARMRRANSYSVLLELSALALANWRINYPIGPMVVASDSEPLFNQLYVYSTNSPSGTLPDIDDLSRVVMRQVQLHAEDEMGVGAQVRESRQRLGELWRKQSRNGIPSIMSFAGHAILRFPRAELARYFAKRSAAEFVRATLGTGSEESRGGLWAEVTQGNYTAWFERVAAEFKRGLPPVEVDENVIGNPPRPTGIREVMERAEADFETWKRAAEMRRQWLREEVQGALRDVVAARIASGNLGSLLRDLPRVADEISVTVEPYLQELRQRPWVTHEEIEAARKEMTASGRPKLANVSRFAEMVRRRYAYEQQLFFAERLSLIATDIASGDASAAAVAALFDLQTEAGRYESAVESWRPERPGSPCERYVLRNTGGQDDIEELYARRQIVWGYSGSGSNAAEGDTAAGDWTFRPDTLSAVSERVSQVLLGGAGSAGQILAEVEGYFAEEYAASLSQDTLTGVLWELHGSLDRLKQDLEWARSTATGWLVPVTVGDAMQQVRSETVVEIPSGAEELSDLITHTFNVAPVVGNRGEEDWLVVYKAVHGVGLDLIPYFRPHGPYFQDYVAEQAAWEQIQRRPVHGDHFLEGLVRDMMAFYLTAPQTGPATPGTNGHSNGNGRGQAPVPNLPTSHA